MQTKYVYLNQVTWLMSMKTRLKLKNRSRRYDIKRPRHRHGHKCTKYKTCLMVICIKQQLRKIWNSIHEKVKQHSLREKCPYSELFCSEFSRIRTKYGEILSLRIHSKYGRFLLVDWSWVKKGCLLKKCVYNSA